MGYRVKVTECKINLRKKYFRDACDHLLNIGFLEDKEKMSGRRFDGTKDVDNWYAWVNMKELKECLLNGSLPEVFGCFGFDYAVDSSGNLVELYYDMKTGDEQHLLNCLREFFDEGDFIEWRGEEGETWRNHFANTYMYIQNPITVWSNVDVFK